MIDGLKDRDALTALYTRCDDAWAAPLPALPSSEASAGRAVPRQIATDLIGMDLGSVIDTMADRQHAAAIGGVLRRASVTLLDGPASLLMA